MVAHTLKRAYRIVRAPFLIDAMVSVVIGGAVAWYEGTFHGGYFALTLLAALLVHAGLNLSNDYFDHLLGPDEVEHELTPFSGGSRVIQDGLVTPRQMARYSLACYALGTGIGLYLAATRGWALLLIIAFGLVLAVSHNGPPLRIYYLAPGAGEIAIGVGFGPTMVLGTYFVQTGTITLPALWASLSNGLFMSALLCLNAIPDYVADKAVGKKTIAAVLGRRGAVSVLMGIIAAGYGVVVAGVAAGLMPAATLVVLLTAPIAVRTVRVARRHYDEPARMVPANAGILQVQAGSGFLVGAGYVLARLLGGQG